MWIFFLALFSSIFFVFKSAFSTNFFQDDYFFLKISRAENISDFVKFFSPIRVYSYKPLATEVFYFTLHLFKENVIIGRVIVFAVFFIGLIYLYKIIVLIFKKELLAKLVVLIYGLSFIHVFQLYWFATFQEVAVFVFLSISFYLFLKNKYLLSNLFFVLALLCKETAILYSVFLGVYTLIFDKKKLRSLFTYIAVSLIFWFIYRYSLKFVTSLDNYKMVLNPKLLLNNSLWYLLWAIGLPNFLPDYFRSIIGAPINTFWQILKIPYAKIYLLFLFTYLFFLFLGFMYFVIARRRNDDEAIPLRFSRPFESRNDILFILYLIFNFFIFLGPILFFRHKWMIRLSMPFIFIAVMEGLIIYGLLINKNKWIKYLGLSLIIIYIVWNFFGVKVHETTSTYVFENKIYLKTKAYFDKHRKEIVKYDIIYLKDASYNLPAGWNGSEKLINSFAEESFIDHFLPGKKIKVIFGFQNKKIPENAYIINSNELLP